MFSRTFFWRQGGYSHQTPWAPVLSAIHMNKAGCEHKIILVDEFHTSQVCHRSHGRYEDPNVILPADHRFGPQPQREWGICNHKKNLWLTELGDGNGDLIWKWKKWCLGDFGELLTRQHLCPRRPQTLRCVRVLPWYSAHYCRVKGHTEGTSVRAVNFEGLDSTTRIMDM